MPVFPLWFVSNCGEAVDIDAGLKEVRDCPDERWTLRALCGHSVGMPPEDGYLAARELFEAVCWAAEGYPEGKKRLAAILGCNGDDYQRALYYAVAGRGPIDMLEDLRVFVGMMEARCDAAHEAELRQLGVTPMLEPYRFFEEADGPRGRFDPDFAFAPAWEGVARSL